jgi:hypothetical protein
MNNWKSTTVVLGLLVLAVLSRWIPHPPNFSPLIGIALFAGSRFDSKFLALGLPVMALALSDLFLGWHSTLPFVYGALLVMAWASWKLLKPAHFGWSRVGVI